MKVLEDGHTYVVSNVDGPEQQTIKFVRRIPTKVSHEGILMQELLRVLIHRMNFLSEQVPCAENVKILQNLRESLVLLESRAARRSIERAMYPERLDWCQQCGHILCLCVSDSQAPTAPARETRDNER